VVCRAIKCIQYRTNLCLSLEGQEIRLSLSRASNSSNERFKFLHIAGLDIDRPRACKAADKPFTRLETGHTSTASLLNAVIAAPCHEMAVVDYVLLTGLKIQLIHRPKARQPQQPIPINMINEQTFTREQCLPEPLRLSLLCHALCTRNKRILPNLPLRPAIQMQRNNIAEHRRRKGHFAVSRKRRFCHRAAGEHLFHTEFDLASDLDGRGHMDHHARLGTDRRPVLEVDG